MILIVIVTERSDIFQSPENLPLAKIAKKRQEGLTTKGTKDSKGETTDFMDGLGFLTNNASFDAFRLHELRRDKSATGWSYASTG